MPLVIAHRGASAREPENSLAAFRAALQLGADGVELDVHETADGRFVVHHDAAVDGLTIPTASLAAVRERRLGNGEAVPTLDEALETLGPDPTVYVEIKTLDAEHDPAFLAALARGPAPLNYHVHAFDHRIVRRLLDRHAGLVGGVLSASYPIDPLIQLVQAGAAELWQREHLIDDALVTAVHAARKRVIAWTADAPSRIEALAALGVDGICTNTPDVARSIVE